MNPHDKVWKVKSQHHGNTIYMKLKKINTSSWMHQEQLSLEESWQLAVFPKHNEQGKRGGGRPSTHGAKWRAWRGLEPQGLGECWSNWNTKDRDKGLVYALTQRPHRKNHYRDLSQELGNRWGYFYSSAISFCFSSSKSQLQRTWEDVRIFFTTQDNETAINKYLPRV